MAKKKTKKQSSGAALPTIPEVPSETSAERPYSPDPPSVNSVDAWQSRLSTIDEARNRLELTMTQMRVLLREHNFEKWRATDTYRWMNDKAPSIEAIVFDHADTPWDDQRVVYDPLKIDIVRMEMIMDFCTHLTEKSFDKASQDVRSLMGAFYCAGLQMKAHFGLQHRYARGKLHDRLMDKFEEQMAVNMMEGKDMWYEPDRMTAKSVEERFGAIAVNAECGRCQTKHS